MTALLVQAIATMLQAQAGNLKMVYLVSHKQEHYRWFIDRGYVFQAVFDQINQFRSQIDALNLPPQIRDRLVGPLGNLQSSVLSNVNVFLDQSQYINQSGGVSLTADKVDVSGDLIGQDKISAP